jgi:hypothetical protein
MLSMPRRDPGQLVLLSTAASFLLMAAAAVAMPSDHQFVASSTVAAADHQDGGQQQQLLLFDFGEGKVNNIMLYSVLIDFSVLYLSLNYIIGLFGLCVFNNVLMTEAG